MKKNLMMMSLAMMGLCAFTACSSDDDKKGSETVSIQDSEYDAIINQYVDAVVLPTYADLKTKNSALYDAVVAFGNNPSQAGFSQICEAWLTAGEPWESSEAFLFGPVADYGLDPNMDSWPLDQEAIVNTLMSQQWNEMEWTGDYDEDDDAIAAAQNIRGFHTLEFLAFRDGKARTLNDAATDDDLVLSSVTRAVIVWLLNSNLYSILTCLSEKDRIIQCMMRSLPSSILPSIRISVPPSRYLPSS